MSYQNILVSNKKWHFFLTTLSSPDYILIFKYFRLLCCLFKAMSGMVFFICAFSYILNARTTLILTDMREGVDLMHQACLFLRAMCVLGVVNQDTSLGTVPLMGWVEDSLHLNCINLNVRFCKEVFFLHGICDQIQKVVLKIIGFLLSVARKSHLLWFCNITSTNGLEILCHFVSQSAVKPK